MSRRSTPQKQIDDQAFPVRIKLAVGGGGLPELGALNEWLKREVGGTDSAIHSASSSGTDAIAIYLRDIDTARRLLVAFPNLVLADGTQAATYSTPMHFAAWTSGELLGVCNLYSMTKGQAAIIAITRAMVASVGNLPGLPAVFPDQFAPVVRNTPSGRELAMLRWGMPSPPFALQNRKTDTGITNIRNTLSPHWRPCPNHALRYLRKHSTKRVLRRLRGFPGGLFGDEVDDLLEVQGLLSRVWTFEQPDCVREHPYPRQ